MRYVYVENGSILEGPCQVPVSWRHVSNMSALSNSGLISLGWFPYYESYPAISPRTEKYEIASTTFYADRVEVVYETVDKTPSELSSYLLEGWNGVRRQRNVLLSACDWTQLEDSTVDKVAWANYRQALRNIPQNFEYPEDVVWPQTP